MFYCSQEAVECSYCMVYLVPHTSKCGRRHLKIVIDIHAFSFEAFLVDQAT